MNYVYPAIFTPAEEGGYLVDFPDLPGCYTDGDTLPEALENARDVLPLMLWTMEDHNENIPTPSNPLSLVVPANGFVSLIDADTLEYRKRYDTKAVKKTLTIPRWLNTMAAEKNINFSQVLQNALMQQLGVQS